MNILLLVACTGMIAGAFLLFGINPSGFADGLFRLLSNPNKSIRDRINEETKHKKSNLFKREIRKAQDILGATGRSGQFPKICTLSLGLIALGAAIAIGLNNFFLVPVLAIGMMFLPFWYLRLTEINFKKNVAAELETALSIITTAYLRNEDILTAVEENLDYLNPPVQNVFRDFAVQVRMVNPDMEAALKTMCGKLDNDVFHEWCDAMAACLCDRSLKTTLTPIITKLSDMRIVNAELELLVLEPRKDFAIMVFLVVGNIPLLHFLNFDWYKTLMNTVPGHITMAVCAVAIFICAAFVIKLTKPIEYRR